MNSHFLLSISEFSLFPVKKVHFELKHVKTEKYKNDDITFILHPAFVCFFKLTANSAAKIGLWQNTLAKNMTKSMKIFLCLLFKSTYVPTIFATSRYNCPRSKWTIYKYVLDNSKEFLSVGSFRISQKQQLYEMAFHNMQLHLACWYILISYDFS